MLCVEEYVEYVAETNDIKKKELKLALLQCLSMLKYNNYLNYVILLTHVRDYLKRRYDVDIRTTSTLDCDLEELIARLTEYLKINKDYLQKLSDRLRGRKTDSEFRELAIDLLLEAFGIYLHDIATSLTSREKQRETELVTLPRT